MRKRSEQKDPQDQEIIDLTEVVEEPSESFSPGAPQGHRSHDSGAGQSSTASEKRTTDSDFQTEEDDFDFFTRLDSSERTSSSSGPAFEMNGTQRRSTDDFEDIEDLFEELDLEFSARQDQTSAGFINDRPGSTKGGPQNPGQSTTKDASSDLIQAMETRIQALEEKISSSNRESWKDVENRIMSRLDTMVQERIREAKLAIQEEIETSLRPYREGQQKDSIQELAQEIEDIKHYAVGPETVSALKNELWTELSQRIDETVPHAAAKVVREEIQALLDEEAGDGPNASEEEDNMRAND